MLALLPPDTLSNVKRCAIRDSKRYVPCTHHGERKAFTQTGVDERVLLYVKNVGHAGIVSAESAALVNIISRVVPGVAF